MYTKNLAHLAFKSEDTFGRFLPLEHDRDSSLYSWMDPFDIDKIKIECSKALRRLRGKTQVISGRKNIHIRDRLMHTFEVVAACEYVGHRLALNVPFLRTSALGHDLGHVVFGHLGETFLAERLGENFRHERFVVFVLEIIERSGDTEINPDAIGLNLSYETLHAILHHSRGSGRMVTKNGIILEDDVLMVCDKLAYIFSDYNDIQRINYPGLNVPPELMKLGRNQTERLYSCLKAFCLESLEKGIISFEDSQEAKDFNVVRDFMYEEVYHKIDRQHLKDILNRVFDFFERYYHNPRMSALAMALMAEEGVYIVDGMICDYSDSWIMEQIQDPNSSWIMKQLHDTTKFAVAEFLPKIPEWAELDFCHPEKFMDKNNFGKMPKMECFSR
jgi:dGTP triphosphohydrolase